MLYEVRTYDLRPHAVAEAERRLAQACAARTTLSPLGASFHTEIGPLNQVILIWPYRDRAERDRVTNEAQHRGILTPNLDDLIVEERFDFYVPFACSPALVPGDLGPFFELRTYTYSGADELPKIERAWQAALPERLRLGPLVGVWHAADDSSKMLHIWPYRSLDARQEIRRKARETGNWPPLALARKQGLPTYTLLHQENKIVVPSDFSPLR